MPALVNPAKAAPIAAQPTRSRNLRTFPKPTPVEIFAIEPHAIQVTWHSLVPGTVTVTLDGRNVEITNASGAGAVTFDGLAPATVYDVVVRPSSGPPVRLHATTAKRPPGEHLARIGSINDAHIGSADFGFAHEIKETPTPPTPSGFRCAQAALDELDAWGMEQLFIKGDLIHKCQRSEWADAARLLADRPWPIHIQMGNHERVDDATAHDGIALVGAEPIKPVRFVDVAGLRVILAETALAGTNRGVVAEITNEITEVAAEAGTPVLVMTHHHLQSRKRAWMLPIGVTAVEAEPLLDALGRANPNTMTVSGHTHRHRRREHGPVTVAEVGSPKDYPGVWSGYDVYEGGIRQIVRRIERPDCISWTEQTGRAIFGVWRRWSPGTINDRCFTKLWG